MLKLSSTLRRTLLAGALGAGLVGVSALVLAPMNATAQSSHMGGFRGGMHSSTGGFRGGMHTTTGGFRGGFRGPGWRGRDWDDRWRGSWGGYWGEPDGDDWGWGVGFYGYPNYPYCDYYDYYYGYCPYSY